MISKISSFFGYPTSTNEAFKEQAPERQVLQFYTTAEKRSVDLIENCNEHIKYRKSEQLTAKEKTNKIIEAINKNRERITNKNE